MYFPNLQRLDCDQNKLTLIPAFGTNINFPNLQQYFIYSFNQLMSLPAFATNMNFHNLQEFNCFNNNLTLLPNMNLPNLQTFNCSNKKLTFSEVLWFVLQTIHNDLSIEVQNEIKKILNDEMKESECKCFTVRINRSVNCLNGFSSHVKINIQDSYQIRKRRKIYN
jgi:Leucine-rich repeat (LRR) protein